MKKVVKRWIRTVIVLALLALIVRWANAIGGIWQSQGDFLAWIGVLLAFMAVSYYVSKNRSSF